MTHIRGLCVCAWGVVFLALAMKCGADEVKAPNVAGSFYPDDPAALARMVDGFLTDAAPQEPAGSIFGIIVPHAGYGYSGRVAAFAYKLIEKKPFRTVVIIGTSHHYPWSGVSVYPRGAFRTPFGNVPIDEPLALKLISPEDGITVMPQVFEKEHSVEVQIPFLQRALTDFSIVPVMMGQCSLATCKALGHRLKEALAGRTDCLVVVSTDMYHGYDYDEADAVDGLTLSALRAMDADALYRGLNESTVQLCGGVGVVAAITAARELGHEKLIVLAHTNSAEVTGTKTKGAWTVGYSSCVIDSPSPQPPPAGEASSEAAKEGGTAMLNAQQRKRLLQIARTSIETYLKTGEKLQVSEDDALLATVMGAFVTLHKGGELRGCIGSIVGNEPLYLTVRDMAVEAAVNDPRFRAVTLKELPGLEIEVSALSPLERVSSADAIRMGIHGVIVRRGVRSGVYLPQVATETGWGKEEFLSSLCEHKAGLPADAWKDPATELSVFSAEVFSEKEFR